MHGALGLILRPATAQAADMFPMTLYQEHLVLTTGLRVDAIDCSPKPGAPALGSIQSVIYSEKHTLIILTILVSIYF